MLQISTKSTAQFLSNSCFKNGTQKQKFPIWKILIQNDRVYAPLGSQKRQVSAELLRTRSTFSKSVMVSVAVSLLGTTELMFIEPGVKINGAYYHDVLLGQHLLPAIRSVAGDFFTCNASAHRAGDTVEFLSRNTPDFISPLPWQPNSPDQNPVDYEVWGVLQQRIYRSRIRDVDHLKQRLIEECRCFDQNIIDRAVRQWRLRLLACVCANGCHLRAQTNC